MSFYRRHNAVRNNPIPVLFFITIIFVFGFLHHDYLFSLLTIIISIMLILNCVREKMVYDNRGIILCNIWGRKYQILWNDVVLVEDTFEDPRLCRGAPYRIVKITYKNDKNKTEVVKYSYAKNVGLAEFLSFYYSQINK